jgi:Mitochondrial carrier protein
MEETIAKDVIMCASYFTAEVLVYPISSLLTRVQAIFVNHTVLQRSFSIYSGGSSLLLNVPGFLLRIKISEVCDPYLRKEMHYSQFTTYVLVSSFADIFNSILRAPAENYRQQFQTGNYTSFSKFYKDYLGHLGPFSFWRGASLIFLRDSIFNTSRFWILEKAQERNLKTLRKKRAYQKYYQTSSSMSQKQEMTENFRIYTWCNILATIPAAVLTSPFDVVKTRVMTSPPEYNQTVLQIVKDIFKEEGFVTFFRGAGLRALYVCSLISLLTSLDFYLTLPIKEAEKTHKIMENKDFLSNKWS